MEWLSDLCKIIKENWLVLFITFLIVGNFIEEIIRMYLNAKYGSKEER